MSDTDGLDPSATSIRPEDLVIYPTGESRFMPTSSAPVGVTFSPPVAPLGQPVPPTPPAESEADRFVGVIKSYVDQLGADIIDRSDVAIEQLVEMIQYQSARIDQLEAQVSVLAALSGDQYRAFVVEEARRMGVRASDLVVRKGGGEG